MELANDQTDRFGPIKVDRISQFGDYYSSIPVWDWRNCMRAAVSFFETAAFFVTKMVTQRAEFPRISSSREVRIIVAPTCTTRERIDAYQGYSKVV